MAYDENDKRNGTIPEGLWLQPGTRKDEIGVLAAFLLSRFPGLYFYDNSLGRNIFDAASLARLSDEDWDFMVQKIGHEWRQNVSQALLYFMNEPPAEENLSIGDPRLFRNIWINERNPEDRNVRSLPSDIFNKLVEIGFVKTRKNKKGVFLSAASLAQQTTAELSRAHTIYPKDYSDPYPMQLTPSEVQEIKDLIQRMQKLQEKKKQNS
jgi:hypothetical protein